MSNPTETTLALLRSIDASLKALLALQRGSVPKAIATDEDLDSQYGDPVVKFMPRDWTGEDFKGRHMSEMPAALLDMLGDTYDYFAQKAEESGELTSSNKPVAPYKRKDAARARGWAKRVRAGKGRTFTAPPPLLPMTETVPGWATPTGWEPPPPDEDDIPF
jgi:hypothetical protein